MKIKVTVLETEQEYEKWLGEQTPVFSPKKTAPGIPETVPVGSDSIPQNDTAAAKAMAMNAAANTK
jgi:hypothetical protein